VKSMRDELVKMLIKKFLKSRKAQYDDEVNC